MPYDHLPPVREHSVLCVRSRRVDPFVDEVLDAYTACVLHDAKLACRKAQLGVFDFYLVIDLRSNDAPLYFWNNVRKFDANTPCVLVVAQPFGEAQVFRRDYDAVVMAPTLDTATINGAIQRLLATAEHRGLEARRLVARAVQRDIAERLAMLEHRVQLSRESVARAQEHVMRALAIREFLHSGGTRALFERYWGDTFEEALRDCYARRVESEPFKSPSPGRQARA